MRSPGLIGEIQSLPAPKRSRSRSYASNRSAGPSDPSPLKKNTEPARIRILWYKGVSHNVNGENRLQAHTGR